MAHYNYNLKAPKFDNPQDNIAQRESLWHNGYFIFDSTTFNPDSV